MTDSLSMRTSSRHGVRRALRSMLLALCVVGGAAAWTGVTTAHAASPVVAPAAVVSACQTQRTSDQKTADTPQLVSGTVPLSGCIADGGSGVAHLYLDWSGPDGTSGHVCADPAIAVDGSWHCAWNTDPLARGAYSVTLTAYDLVGNRGSFDRKYDVISAPAPAPAPGTVGSPPTGTTTTSISTSTDSPAGSALTETTTTTTTGLPTTATTPTTTSSAATTAADTTPPVTGIATTDSAAAPPSGSVTADPLTAPVPLTTTTEAPTDVTADQTPLIPQLPTAAGLDPLQRLILDQIETCAQTQAATLATHPSAAPDADAQIALTCIQPALVQLGASSEDIDELPVPPALRIVFADSAQLASARHVLPLTLAGVPLELLTQDQLTAEQAASGASDTTTATATAATTQTSTTAG